MNLDQKIELLDNTHMAKYCLLEGMPNIALTHLITTQVICEENGIKLPHGYNELLVKTYCMILLQDFDILKSIYSGSYPQGRLAPEQQQALYLAYIRFAATVTETAQVIPVLCELWDVDLEFDVAYGIYDSFSAKLIPDPQKYEAQLKNAEQALKKQPWYNETYDSLYSAVPGQEPRNMRLAELLHFDNSESPPLFL